MSGPGPYLRLVRRHRPALRFHQDPRIHSTIGTSPARTGLWQGVLSEPDGNACRARRGRPGFRSAARLSSSIRNSAAPAVADFSMRTRPTRPLPKAHYTHRVISLAVRLVVEDGWPYQSARWHLWRDHRVFVPYATMQNGGEAGGKRAAGQMDAAYLEWALADCSGYVAIDELYDSPFCVLSIVANRTFKRLLYEVLDHDPTHQDILTFLRRFQASLPQRALALVA